MRPKPKSRLFSGNLFPYQVNFEPRPVYRDRSERKMNIHRKSKADVHALFSTGNQLAIERANENSLNSAESLKVDSLSSIDEPEEFQGLSKVVENFTAIVREFYMTVSP